MQETCHMRCLAATGTTRGRWSDLNGERITSAAFALESTEARPTKIMFRFRFHRGHAVSCSCQRSPQLSIPAVVHRLVTVGLLIRNSQCDYCPSLQSKLGY